MRDFLEVVRRQLPSAAFYAALGSLLVLPLLLSPGFSTADGPAHWAHLHMFRDLLADPASDLSRFLQINLDVFPNWGVFPLIALAAPWIPPTLGDRVTSALLVLFSVWAFHTAFRSIHRGQNLFLSTLTAPLLLGMYLQFGFYNYLAGAALYWLAIGAWQTHLTRDAGVTVRFILVCAAAATALYFCHLVPWALFAVVGSVMLTQQILRRRASGLSPSVAGRLGLAWMAILAPGILLAVRYAANNLATTGSVSDVGSAMERFLRLISLNDFFWIRNFDGIREDWLYLVWGLVAVVLCVRATVEPRRRAQAAGWGVPLAVLTAIYLMMPDTFAGGTLGVARLSPILAGHLTLWLGSFEWSGRTAQVVRGATLVAAVLASALTWQQYSRTQPFLEDYRRAAQAIPDGSFFLQIQSGPRLTDRNGKSLYAMIHPLNHLWGYLYREKKLVNLSDYFVKSSNFPVRSRPDVPVNDLYDRCEQSAVARISDYEEATGLDINYVLVTGDRLLPPEAGCRELKDELSTRYRPLEEHSSRSIVLYQKSSST